MIIWVRASKSQAKDPTEKTRTKSIAMVARTATVLALASSAAAFVPATLPLRSTSRVAAAPLSIAMSADPAPDRRHFLQQASAVVAAHLVANVRTSPKYSAESGILLPIKSASALSPDGKAVPGSVEDEYSPASIEWQARWRSRGTRPCAFHERNNQPPLSLFHWDLCRTYVLCPCGSESRLHCVQKCRQRR
jgi:hypothetical protein